MTNKNNKLWKARLLPPVEERQISVLKTLRLASSAELAGISDGSFPIEYVEWQGRVWVVIDQSWGEPVTVHTPESVYVETR